ncbi:hypothetical protein AWW67_13140 [Roseivirga seohaensis]|jgi:DNA repair protein RadC|uniref:MPN domain-containing protein n=1 Tax=Roseivirga seohaensis TaxID=1914963 RepID=A0A150XKY2_9BACT|nr:hypothetical protein AWW67_13140 [Roseivirga seohaensis]|tara:strand:- start:5233 stop:5724 length:492 start_codon:yes stop_codon:yes gene_type:complete
MDKKAISNPFQSTAAPFSSKVNEVELHYCRPRINTLPGVSKSSDVAAIFRSIYPPGKMDLKEYFYVAYLTRSNHVLGVARLSEGSLTGTVVDIREVFVLALKLNAIGMVLCHNHPSGTMRPSPSDISLTNKVKQVAQLMDMALLDHIILNSEGYYSFTDEGDL